MLAQPDCHDFRQIFRQFLFPNFGVENRAADAHLQPFANRLRQAAHGFDEQAPFNCGKRRNGGIQFAPVPTDEHGVLGVETQVDGQMIGAVVNVRRRCRRGKRSIHFEAAAAQTFALAGAEPEAAGLQLLQNVIQTRRVFALLERSIVHFHFEIENRVAKQGFVFIVGIGLGGPAIFVQANAHTQIKQAVAGITLFAQIALHALDQIARHLRFVQSHPQVIEQTHIAAGARGANKGVHQRLRGAGDFSRQ